MGNGQDFPLSFFILAFQTSPQRKNCPTNMVDGGFRKMKSYWVLQPKIEQR